MYQMIWHCFQSIWVIFGGDIFWNSFHAHICRQLGESSLRLKLCTLQTCLANLLTEISLTFELLWESWPPFHSRLSTLWSFRPSASLFQSRLSHLAQLISRPMLRLYQTTSGRSTTQLASKKDKFYLFVLMGEGESLYGGLDRSTVYTAQSVLQLQKLLHRKQYIDMYFNYYSLKSDKRPFCICLLR